MNEIVEEFLVETGENLDQLDADLVALEADPTSPTLLASVFRTIHSVKGTSGFLGFSRLEALSHAAESLLAELRDGRITLSPARADVLLEVVDATRGLLGVIEATGSEDERDVSGLIERIEALQHDEKDAPQAMAPAPREPGEKAKLVIPPPPPWDSARAGSFDASSTTPTPAPPAPKKAPQPVALTPSPATTISAERSVRVDVDLLDRIIRQVGELVLARNQLSALVRQGEDPALNTTLQRLSMIVSELQEEAMKTRMQPVEQLFAKLPRVVRDLAAQFSKKVRLEVEGGETELDRSLLEAVKDPLTHIVRNAIDHGLETPEARRAAGRDETGTLAVRAYHESGQVVLEVSDDGAGIDPSHVAAAALERGLVTPGELAAMAEREIVDLVFRPGFSTAAAVTNVSGRGVGMDVVRTNVEAIGGTVDLQSTPGAGTTIRLRIPLTLAIVPALLVGCAGQRYAIAQSHLLELVQVRQEDASERLERIGDGVVYRLRDTLLPLVRLEEVLGLKARGASRHPKEAAFAQADATTIVVVQADGLLLGLSVDEVIGTEEIVVKPLGQHVKHVSVFAGATILGDGGVALILDVPGVVAAANAHDGALAVQERAGTPTAGKATGERHSFVVLRVGERRRVAVPLAAVSRLEEAPAEAIEHAAGRLVLQYRGELMPLLALGEVLGEASEALSAGEANQRYPVVVYTDGERRVGLLASEILDIVEGTFEIQAVGADQAIVGSTIVHGHATDVIDVAAALARSKLPARPREHCHVA
jgi:two-component system chemotaxis sensor kinase CheA